MSKTIVFTCDKCKSTNVKAYYDVYDQVFDIYRGENRGLISCKERYNCTCLDCGSGFVEY